jgi:arylsulfatase A-like enzyme
VRGDYKILMAAETDRWELFNLRKDPGETMDLAAAEPALLAELIAEWESFAAANGVVY